MWDGTCGGTYGWNIRVEHMGKHNMTEHGRNMRWNIRVEHTGDIQKNEWNIRILLGAEHTNGTCVHHPTVCLSDSHRVTPSSGSTHHDHVTPVTVTPCLNASKRPIVTSQHTILLIQASSTIITFTAASLTSAR